MIQQFQINMLYQKTCSVLKVSELEAQSAEYPHSFSKQQKFHLQTGCRLYMACGRAWTFIDRFQIQIQTIDLSPHRYY